MRCIYLPNPLVFYFATVNVCIKACQSLIKQLLNKKVHICDIELNKSLSSLV